MKQGTGNRQMGDMKQEPKSTAVCPAGAGEIGLAQPASYLVEPLYEGRGYKAPAIRSTQNKSGSQGSY